MKKTRVGIGAVFLVCSWMGGRAALSPATVPVTSFEVRVVDAISGHPVHDMRVEVRSKGYAKAGLVIAAQTDARGIAILEHQAGFAEVESVIALGDDLHHYTSLQGSPGSDRFVLAVMPYSAFVKSPLISAASGTAGVPWTVDLPTEWFHGPFSHSITVDVPPHVLPADAQIWVAPRPIWYAVTNDTADDHAPAHFGQMHMQLRTAEGVEIKTILKEPGLSVGVTPWWFPADTFPIDDNVVVRRLNTDTLEWDVTTPKGLFATATGVASFSLRSFSCFDLFAERYGNGLLGNGAQQTNPPTSTPPPSPVSGVDIVWDDCFVPIGSFLALDVVCCQIFGQATKQQTKGTRYTAFEQTASEIEQNFGISVGESGKLFGKISYGKSSKITKTAGQSIESEIEDSDSLVVPGPGNPQNLPNCQCLSGTCRVTHLGKRGHLVKAGAPTIDFVVFAGMGVMYCLQYGECLGQNCNDPGPHRPFLHQKPGTKICADGWPECK